MSDTRDADFQEHVDTWRRFTRLTIISVAGVVAVLIVMALTLV